MGEIADMMLSGILDCETGEYLGDECGFPRTARDMHPDDWHGSRRSRSNAKTGRRRAQRKRANAKKQGS